MAVYGQEITGRFAGNHNFITWFSVFACWVAVYLRRFIGDSKLGFAVSLKTLRAFFVFVNFSLAIKTFFSQVI